jgi:hypothetical protein
MLTAGIAELAYKISRITPLTKKRRSYEMRVAQRMALSTCARKWEGIWAVRVVIADTAERANVAGGAVYRGSYPVGSLVQVVYRAFGGPAFVTITDLDPSEVLILGSAGARLTLEANAKQHPIKTASCLFAKK